ncbi:ABC transporter permease [Pusillimonas sp.]|uniref:ABC transporter permease n=1 Tax=Pusillimonas sp. TaxID=3040095 RepID=UPI0037CB3C74
MAGTLFRWLRPLVFPALLIGALEIYTRRVAPNSDALAPPSEALSAFIDALFNGDIISATGFTLMSAGLGLALACIAGIGLGIVLGLSPRAARMSFFSIEVFRPIPSVALIPLAMLIFGFGVNMEVSVIAFATFWPMLILTQAAARQVEPILLEVSQALQLTYRQQVWKIILPSMLPRLFVALRQGVAIALVVAVTVEIVANPHGMGYAIMIAQQSLQPALMLAWLFWIGVVGYVINELALLLQAQVDRRMGGRP